MRYISIYTQSLLSGALNRPGQQSHDYCTEYRTNLNKPEILMSENSSAILIKQKIKKSIYYY